jgi:3'-phosphoadenosine 5'-phosphosulfate sulfotransferase (PAPS reductase)/FAD synthetase
MNLAPHPELDALLEQGAPIAISISGGKDSDAMTWAIIDRFKGRNPLTLIHAHLGRAELKATPAHIHRLAEATGLPLHIVQHSKFDLVGMIRNRMKTRPDVPPWPSPSIRQCTSDQKRGPISKWIRNHYPTGHVICAMGLRAQESPNRARKPVCALRHDCCKGNPHQHLLSRRPFRRVYDYLAIHHWKLPDVWRQLQGREHHEAYDRGNERVSCALCILATVNDLRNGADQDPELFREYCDIEIESGFSFRQNLWIGTVARHLLRPDQVTFYTNK